MPFYNYSQCRAFHQGKRARHLGVTPTFLSCTSPKPNTMGTRWCKSAQQRQPTLQPTLHQRWQAAHLAPVPTNTTIDLFGSDLRTSLFNPQNGVACTSVSPPNSWACVHIGRLAGLEQAAAPRSNSQVLLQAPSSVSCDWRIPAGCFQSQHQCAQQISYKTPSNTTLLHASKPVET
jgi:hypothetical protein